MDKRRLRIELRALRRQRGPDVEAGAALASGLAALRRDFGAAADATLAGFLPAPGEPDVRQCLAQAWARGAHVVVPRTLPDCGLEWLAWTPDAPLQPDRHGLQAPTGHSAEVALQGAAGAVVMLVPALAVDRRGTRLGHGAGYYDRVLSRLPRWPSGPLRVAVVHPQELLDEPLPVEPHDEPVDAVLTSRGWRRAAHDVG